MISLLNSFNSLRQFCESQQFKGWDPYDGLNSKVFQAIPFLKKSAFCRLAVIQGFKRLSFNLRPLFLIPKKYNAKGIALFLQGYCNLYQVVSHCSSLEKALGTKEMLFKQINELAELLIVLQSKGYSGACWGYDFDWQSKAFFLASKTPTVVATSFVVEALLSAYEITKKETYYSSAVSAADFILDDLNRISKPRGFMFSYSPMDTRAVYNASLLGTKTLSLIYHYTREERLKEAARASAIAVCDRQNEDGSFPHSDQIGNKWRDNFHTGFKLESLIIYQNLCDDTSFQDNIQKGYTYWINHFFIPEKGIAKYYDTSDENSLIDLHCVAQAIPTLCKLGRFDEQRLLIDKLLNWAVVNMQDKKGYFYFQKRDKKINKINYMRWPNAWMFYGMSYWIKYSNE
ncbi:hypothetical protein CE91St19_31580 [Odoribacter laneus]|jgi:hypothetical protein|uniref:glycoside hydrolase family 88 protein n=1 Tax=Odoribacter laneus TaxID=626933 RepID=UPI0018990277|nr:glycoside hydrolase family 88 protein [Odoribacter laneus]GKI23756.1 hypothetical protein CE91St19_31580 [Odoribacter laneus]GKI27090.1 hypothetical protein CE91St20_32270 [Odoribacter laneus]